MSEPRHWPGIEAHELTIEWDPCPCCDGSGEHSRRVAVDAYEEYPCSRCAGSGEVPENDDTLNCDQGPQCKEDTL